MPAMFLVSNSCFSLLLLLILPFFVAYSTTDLSTDAMALLAIKSRLLGDSSSLNWPSANNSNTTTSLVCSWTGVTCGYRHPRVAALDISGMGLLGSLPPEIGNLTFLVFLNMSSNHFNGTLPREWSRLRRLKLLDLGNNYLSGEIPLWIGFLNELRILLLYKNSFTGFLPYSIGNASKLERLSLDNNEMEGSIPSSVFNLSNLVRLNVGSNKFSGTIPSHLCSGFPKIKLLILQNNMLEGEIPSNISACTQLQIIDLSINMLSGSIPFDMSSPFSQLKHIGLGKNRLVGELPKTLGEWKALEYFTIYTNNISGTIPLGLSNLTNLDTLVFANNKITGTIPNELGMLGNLKVFIVQDNNLSGEISGGIFNISVLELLSINRNNITGQLPINFCSRLTNLKALYLGENELFGELPQSISNCSSLQILSVQNNHFGGIIPTIGDMRFLEILHMQVNNFSSGSSTFNFLTSLTRCRHLRLLFLSWNPFITTLPNSVGNLSTSLEMFRCNNCGLYGLIPSEVGNLTSLFHLNLAYNQLEGSIPTTLGKLQNLQLLNLQENKISGFISDSVCNLQSLNYIYLSENQIGDSIPTCIGNLIALRDLLVSNNKLESTIPSSLWQLSNILQLDLSNNLLNGSITYLGNLKVARYVDLSANRFSGVIPTLGDMQSLESLSLAYNQLEGLIPESLGSIMSLQWVNLSHNQLLGEIPRTLQKVSSLITFDVSFNNLSGGIPTEGPFHNFSYSFFESNEGLCGESQFGVPPCKVLKHGVPKNKVVLVVVLVVSSALGISVALFLVYKWCSRFKSSDLVQVTDTQLRDIIPIRISYYDILKATDNFNSDNLIGVGAFGSVYKGVFLEGKTFAIKVFNLQMELASRSFDVECEVLRSLRHRNLCKVISACSNEDFKALILEYMPNGSLDTWIYGENKFLNIMQRFSIMIDVACALDYLHHGYVISIAHCDLKPSNILLNEDMIAHLSDFGIAKLLGVTSGNLVQTSTFATLGYIAPEYGSGGLVSTRCDVFSFGMMLMEVFIAKKPNDDEFAGDLTLRNLVRQYASHGIEKIVDPRLLNLDDANLSVKLHCLSSLLDLALKCSMENPYERIGMKDVVITLKNISSKLCSL